MVWEVKENDLPGHPLRFAAHVERLGNGNTIICNWPGHGYEGKQPMLVEITREKRAVWQFDGRDRSAELLVSTCWTRSRRGPDRVIL